MLDSRSPITLQAWQNFLDTPLSAVLDQPYDVEKLILERFREVVATVPAYQLFLQQQGIDPDQIQTLADFQTLPLTTKDNYLRQHELAQLCRQGQLAQCDMIAVSSGSTGQPSFWPRSLSDELQIATRK